jgi:hypothetical protein
MAGVLQRALTSVEFSSKRLFDRLGHGKWCHNFSRGLYLEIADEMNLNMVSDCPHARLLYEKLKIFPSDE